jgi:hypothetical protein
MNGKNNKRTQIIGSDQRGQILIESILLMVMTIGLLNIALGIIRDKKTFSVMTNAVWAGVAQMAEYGNWPTASPPHHPNSSERGRILDPSQ